MFLCKVTLINFSNKHNTLIVNSPVASRALSAHCSSTQQGSSCDGFSWHNASSLMEPRRKNGRTQRGLQDGGCPGIHKHLFSLQPPLGEGISSPLAILRPRTTQNPASCPPWARVVAIAAVGVSSRRAERASSAPGRTARICKISLRKTLSPLNLRKKRRRKSFYRVHKYW
jgi:hypothetical protein